VVELFFQNFLTNLALFQMVLHHFTIQN